MTVDVDLDPGRGDIEAVAVRCPPGGHQQHLALGLLRARRPREVYADPFSCCRHSPWRCAEPYVETPGIRFREACPDIEVVAGQELPAARDDRHLGAEGPEDVAHLCCDVAPAQHHHGLGQRVEPHHRVRGEVGNLAQPGQRRDDRTRACGQHEPVGAQLVVADAEHLGSGEPGLAEEHVDAAGLAVTDCLPVQRIDPAEDPAADGRPVRSRPSGTDAEPAGVADRLGNVRSMYQHLRRDAPAVQAGPPEAVGFHHRDPPVRELGSRQHVPAAGAYDHQVVFMGGHRLSFLSAASARRGRRCAPPAGHRLPARSAHPPAHCPAPFSSGSAARSSAPGDRLTPLPPFPGTTNGSHRGPRRGLRGSSGLRLRI